MASNSIVDERTLREIYLTGFEIAIKEGGAKSIMSSYNKLNGTYANENEHLLLDILRREWGYKGLIITDWGGENDRILGLKASNEVEMPSTGGETNDDVFNAVKDGALDEKYVDEAIDRIIDLALLTNKNLKDKKTETDKEANHKAALEVARESVVLLKNEGDILPLKPEAKVAIIRYGGTCLCQTRHKGSIECIRLNIFQAGAIVLMPVSNMQWRSEVQLIYLVCCHSHVLYAFQLLASDSSVILSNSPNLICP